jgi:hypothetical protein
MTNTERAFGFFGACLLRGHFWPNQQVSGVDLLLPYLQELSTRDGPQVLFAHLRPPFHVQRKTFTGTVEQIDRFRRSYKSWSEQAAANIKLIQDQIFASDPKAILLVFGDHGIWLSNVTKYTDNKEFYVLDRYAILGGIYPADTCSEVFGHVNGKSHLTMPWVARSLLQCLSAGVDPFLDHQYRHEIVRTEPGQIRFADYLYE